MLHKKGNFKKGIYRPIHRQKYVGKEIPVYRSSWELHFFKWCDRNPNVLEWTSEKVIIPYVSPIDNKVHRYFVDNTVVMRKNGIRLKYLIEIKPFNQTRKPTQSKRKKPSTLLHENITYTVNLAKWEAASKWAHKHGYKFTILTEKELFND